MSRRKLEDREIRKLSKRTNSTYAVTLPVEIIRELKWKNKQKLVVRRSGKKIIIEDWK